MNMKMLNVFVLTLMLSALAFSATDTDVSKIKVDEYFTNPSPMQPGTSDVYLQVTLVNTGESSIENVKLKLELGDEFTPIITTYEIKRMEQAGRYTAVFKFSVKDSVSPGSYDVALKMSFSDLSQGGGSTTKVLQLNVANEQRFEILNLDNMIASGDFDSIRFDLKNSGSFVLSDIYVSLSSDVKFVSPVNKFYIKQIMPGEIQKVTFNVFVDRTTETGVHDLEIDIDSSQLKSIENVGLLIESKPILKIAGVSADDEVFFGKAFSLSVQIENIGTGKARSVSAEIDDGLTSGNKKSYVGTIDSDDTESAIFDITHFSIGMKELKLKVDYLDDQHKEYSQELVISYDVKIDFTPLVTLAVLAGLAYGGYYAFQNRKVLIKKIRQMI